MLQANEFTRACACFKLLPVCVCYLSLSLSLILSLSLSSSLSLSLSLTQNPNKSEGGAYKCVIKNTHGELIANLNLNIEAQEVKKGEPPVFIEKPKITTEKSDKLIIMECLVKSDPKPDVTWEFEGKVISDKSARIKKSIKSGSKENTYILRLELTDPEVDDRGLYTCKVKNTYGETKANLTLNIERKYTLTTH